MREHFSLGFTCQSLSHQFQWRSLRKYSYVGCRLLLVLFFQLTVFKYCLHLFFFYLLFVLILLSWLLTLDSLYRFADANEWSQIYGLMLLPVSIAFCAYALWMYMHRSAMIRRKDPGPCEWYVIVVLSCSHLLLSTLYCLLTLSCLSCLVGLSTLSLYSVCLFVCLSR